MAKQKLNKALVITSTRRLARVLLPNGEIKKVKLRSKINIVTVGDYVKIKEDSEHCFIEEVLPRKSELYRTLGKRRKNIAANLDHLFIVTSVVPLFNTNFIDRVLTVCKLQEIPASIIVNKTDLDLKDTEKLIEIYKNLGYEVIFTSAKEEKVNLDNFLNFLNQSKPNIITLTGISGVGKSTILKRLVGEDIRTQEVSEKTGQGRQTTSQSFGYPYELDNKHKCLLIDLPGIQNFGISHLEKRDVMFGFIDFEKERVNCEYADCYHLEEPNCGVKNALTEGKIATSRYESYLGIIAEIESFKEY